MWQDLIEHHERILGKFVSIVGEIVDALAKSSPPVDWDKAPVAAPAPAAGAAAPAGDNSGSCPFIAEVVKNTTTMHKVRYITVRPLKILSWGETSPHAWWW